MFSKACEYGLRATFYIARESQEGKRVSLKSISEAIDSPMAFTAKVLQELARQGVVDSVRGPKGGFEILPNKQAQVKLSDIVAAIDGDRIYRGCGLGLKACSNEKHCPVHDKFLEIDHTVEFRNFMPDVPSNVSTLSGPDTLYSPNLPAPYNYVSRTVDENTLCVTNAADGSCKLRPHWSY